ncbi:hypothetical protein DESC_770025 [Desulfosarcina cetonica]|nr:hypothetical protein DESC_770025 [Desulfosarcina cetonica]
MTRQPASDIHAEIPMALDAKAHFEPRALQPIHAADVPVACFAGDVALDVALVIEDHVFGQGEDLDPRGGRIAVEIVVLLLDFRVIGDDVVVAEEALFHRRHARMDGFVHIRMAEAAVDGLVAGMQPVAEGNRLGRADARGRRGIEKEEESQHQKDAAHHPDHGTAVRPDLYQRFAEGGEKTHGPSPGTDENDDHREGEQRKGGNQNFHSKGSGE